MPIDIASGNVHADLEDIAIPGKVPLVWRRHFSNALIQQPAGSLGRGWSHCYAVTLTRLPDGFQFVTPTGAVELLPDPNASVENGGIVRHFGAFFEIYMSEGVYVVQTWNVDSEEVWRYVFEPGMPGVPSPLRCIEDVSGQGLDLVWDEFGRLHSVRQRLEKCQLQLSYNRFDQIHELHLLASSGERHIVATYEYDDANRLVAAYDASEIADRYEYDNTNRLVREIFKDGGVFSMRYDDRDRCVLRTGLDHYDEKRLRYLEAARITEVTDSYGACSRYQYLPTGQVTSEWNPLGAQSCTEYDNFGRIISKMDPHGATTTYDYDEFGNRKSVTDPLGNQSVVTYSRDHLPVTLTDPAENLWKREYDTKNRLLASEDPQGKRWSFHYDKDGNTIAVVNPLGAIRRYNYRNGLIVAATDWVGNETRYKHDAFGRMIEKVEPLGAQTSIRRNVLGYPVQITSPDATVVRASYDSIGNTLSIVHENGHLTRYRYGPCRRLREVVDPLGGVVKYTWGSEPTRLEGIVNQKGETHTFLHDEAGRIIQEVSFDGRQQNYTYDAVGNCIKVTNGSGDTILRAFDAMGYLRKQTLSDGAVATYEYGPTGHLIAARNQNIDVYFERDPLGRILREVQGEQWVENQYDAVGNLTFKRTSLEHCIQYEFNENSLIARLSVNDDVLDFVRDERGLELRRSMPGGLWMEGQYDTAGRLTEQRVLSANAGVANEHSQDLVRRTYAYGQVGALTSVNDQQWGQTDFICDSAEQLLELQRHNGPSERFEYDLVGNHSRMSTNGNEGENVVTATYGPGSRLLQRGDTKYQYDPQGRLVQKIEGVKSSNPRTWRYCWNPLDQLTSVTRPDGLVWKYRYDPLGRRIKTIGPGEHRSFVWSDNIIIHELSNGHEKDTWVFEPESFIPLAKIKNKIFHSVITDHLGTPMELINSAGQVVWTATHKAWGAINQLLPSNIDCPIRFQGQWYDEESGLAYNLSRYYDPECARYISTDPIGLRGGLNLFSYVKNPARFVDPWGLCPTNPPPSGGPGSGPHSHGPDDPPLTGMPPNALHTRTSGDGRVAVQNTVYDHNGNAVAHVDFKPHSGPSGPAPSGHAHQFPPGGPVGAGHGPGATHIPPPNVPPDWSRTPPGVPPANPIGTTK